jgi:tetratricopeptide (TPR) repeat protein
MLSHRARYRLTHFWNSVRPWLLTSVGLVALVSLWYFLANVGPGRAVEPIPKAPAKPDDPALVRLANEVAELEKQYQVYSAANIISDEAHAVLLTAVERQRALVRAAPRGDYNPQSELERLQGELDTLDARRAGPRIEALQREGEEALAAMKLDEAARAFRAALELQNRVNGSSALPRFKNYVRVTTLEQSLTSLEVLPIVRERDAALARARAAVADSRWADALAGYIAARDAQDRINREYRNTRHANLAEFDRLEAEIASLNAAGLAANIESKTHVGDAAERAGDHAAAAIAYAEALALQQQINDRFSRSRFVSSTRIEALEVKLQTARSQPIARDLAALDAQISDELRRRRVVSAEQLLPRAMELTERLTNEFPRSRAVDGTLRIKLNYLALKRNDLRRMQDETYDRLLPLVGVSDRLLLASETPQSLYQAVMNINPSRNPGRSLPVDSVSWNDADEFCTRLGWIMGAQVRLPALEELRTAHGQGGGDVRSSADGGRVAATDSGQPNRNGYRDILGNLAEWVAAAPGSETAQVAGGSYLDTPEMIAGFPVEERPKLDRARHIGFRFVLVLPPDRS